jgi:hypothetical protein
LVIITILTNVQKEKNPLNKKATVSGSLFAFNSNTSLCKYNTFNLASTFYVIVSVLKL